MNSEAANVQPEGSGSGVLVSQAVLNRLHDMPKATAQAVAEAIVHIPRRGMPMDLKVPGDPPGTEYYALIPHHSPAPVVIYRHALPEEDGRWLVTALMDQQSYGQYVRGLADDTVVQGIAALVAAGTISMSDYATLKGKRSS